MPIRCDCARDVPALMRRSRLAFAAGQARDDGRRKDCRGDLRPVTREPSGQDRDGCQGQDGHSNAKAVPDVPDHEQRHEKQCDRQVEIQNGCRTVDLGMMRQQVEPCTQTGSDKCAPGEHEELAVSPQQGTRQVRGCQMVFGLEIQPPEADHDDKARQRCPISPGSAWPSYSVPSIMDTERSTSPRMMKVRRP